MVAKVEDVNFKKLYGDYVETYKPYGVINLDDILDDKMSLLGAWGNVAFTTSSMHDGGIAVMRLKDMVTPNGVVMDDIWYEPFTHYYAANFRFPFNTLSQTGKWRDKIAANAYDEGSAPWNCSKPMVTIYSFFPI